VATSVRSSPLQTVAAWEPVWLAPALLILIVAPSRLIPAGWDRAAALFLVVPWVVRLVAWRRPTIATPLDWPLLAFFLMTWVGWWPSIDPQLSWLIFKLNLLSLAIYFMLVNACQTPHHLRLAVSLLLAGGFGLAFLTLFGTDWTLSKLGGLGGVYDLLPKLNVAALNPLGFHPNTAAGLLVLFVPIGLAFVLGGARWWRWLSLVLVGLVSVLLVLTQSRGALMGAVGAGALVLVLQVRWARWLVLLAAVVGGLALANYLASAESVSVLLDQALPLDAGGSFSGRVELWERALYMIQDFSYTGIGMGTFPIVLDKLYPLFLSPPDTYVPHAHQTFLQMAVDFGVPGFVAWFAALSAWLCLSVIAVRQAPTRWHRSVAVGFVGALVALAIHGLTDAPIIYSTKGAALLWTILALQIVLWRLSVDPVQRALVADG
jgi:putative inorganic carbon (HCO3(-)) transporter